MEQIHDVRPPEPAKEPEKETSLPPEKERHAPKQKSGFTFKRKLKLALVIIVLLAIGYSVWWIKSTMALRAEAVELAAQAEAFQKLQSSIVKERDRCESFITQGQGDFGSFEYCKAFVKWVNQQDIE